MKFASKTRELLSVPLLIILIAQFTQSLGQSLYSPFIAPWLMDLGGKSYLRYAIAASVPYLLMFLTTPLWGRLSDIFRRRKLFLALGLLGFSIQYIGLMLVKSEEQFLTVVILMALVIGAYQANLISLASFLAPPSRSGEVVALINISLSLGWLIGSPVGGVAYDSLGASARFIQLPVASMLLLISAILVLLFVPEPETEQKREHASQLAETNEINYTMNKESEANRMTWIVLLWIALLGFILNLAAGSFWNFGFPYFVLELGASGFLFSLMLVLTTALGIPVSKWIGNQLDKKPNFPYLTMISAGYVIVFFGIALTKDPIVGLLLYSIPLFALQMVVLPGLAVQHSPKRARSAAVGLVQGFSLGGSVVGSLFIGYLVDAFHDLGIIPLVVLFMMIIALVVTAFTEFITRGLFRETLPDGPVTVRTNEMRDANLSFFSL